MKQVLKWIPVIILAALVALPAPAQRMGFGPGMGPGWAAGAQTPPVPTALKDYLGLTDQQVQQLTDLRKQVAEENRSIAEQIRAKRQEIAELMKSANPDPLKVGQLHVDIKKLNDQRLAKLEAMRTQAVALLTAAQKQKLAELEKALQLVQAARQAVALGLIAPPQPPAGAGLGLGLGPGPGAPMRNARPGRAGGWF
ncbi:MAG: periplasmic heavy metal sensor [Bryobacteraceae bacterium]